jgi:ribosome-binding protein aMBF1 (putative translation factor)
MNPHTNAIKTKKVVPLDVDFTGLSIKVPHQRLSKAIASARMAKKLSQKDVAKLLKVKSQVVADYEAGKAIPPNSSILLLEKEFGVKLPKPGTPAKEKKLAMEKRNMAEQAKKTGVGKAKAVKVVLADKKIM